MKHFLPVVLVFISTGPLTTTAVATPPVVVTDLKEKLDKALVRIVNYNPDVVKDVLFLKNHESETLALIKEKLKPIRQDKETAKKLLVELGSENEKVWRNAYRELKYNDPRLVYDIQEIYDITSGEQRNRLAAILVACDDYDAFDKKYFKNSFQLGKNRGYITLELNETQGCKSIYQMTTEKTFCCYNNDWTIAHVAMEILASFNNADSITIIKEMATGHPDAYPTIAAKKILNDLQIKEKK